MSVKVVINASTGAASTVPFSPAEETAKAAADAQGQADAAAQAALDANGATLRSRASAAVVANNTFLAIGAPSAAQVTTQVQTLTKECTAIIKLLLSQLADTTGT